MMFLEAEEADKEEILILYKKAVGSEGCTWNAEYPTNQDIESDFIRNDLFCIKNETGEIIGAVSIDDDKTVEALPCWRKECALGAEIARLVVKKEYQNQGIARKLLSGCMDVLKERGFRSAHFLVSKTNERALRSYEKLQFDHVGETNIYHGDWWCYEKEV